MDKLFENLGAAVLAGGRSSRFGREKALVELNGVRLVDWVHARLASMFQEVFVVSSIDSAGNFAGFDVVEDIWPSRGSLGGICTAVKHTRFPAVFVAACDMPFISKAVVDIEVNALAGFDAVVPKLSGGVEPLHAIYRKSCYEPVRESILSGNYKIDNVFSKLRIAYPGEKEIRKKDARLRSFFNINEPEDLDEAIRIYLDSIEFS